MESRNLGNIVLRNLSTIRYLDQDGRDEILIKYIEDQLVVRRYGTKRKITLTLDQFIDLLSFDYIVYDRLVNKNYENLFQECSFLFSTNSFLNKWPELHQHNPELLKVTKDIIQKSLQTKNQNSDHKQYKKLANDTLQQIKQYERS